MFTLKNKVPTGWEMVKLGDVVNILSSGIDRFEGEKKYLSTSSIVGAKIEKIEDIITYKKRQSRANMQPLLNSVWFAKMKDTDKYFIFKKLEDVSKYILSTGFFGLTSSEKCDPNFIYQMIMSDTFKRWKNINSKGSTQKAINNTILLNYTFPLPPLREQNKIAEILSTVDKKIALIDEEIAASELLKKGLMQKLLTEGIGHTEFKDSELGRIPESWEIDILNNLSKVTDSLHMTPEFEEEGFPMVRVADIKNGKLNLSNALKVSKEMYELFTKSYIPKKKDIVLSRVGSYGVSSFVDTEEPFCMGQNTVIINPKIDSFYLYSILNSEEIKKQIENLSYGSGYKSLSLKNIRELKIKLPPLEEQKQIAEILSTVDNKLENLKEKKQSFEELKKGLMQKLLTGEIRV